MHFVISTTRKWISFIRLESFDANTPEGRSSERIRRVAMTAVVSAFAQGLMLLTTLISVPLTLDYLGAERYGLWVTISSLIAILGFADLGMGNGLINAISDANGRDDRNAAGSYVSSAFFMLSGLALVLAVIWIVFYAYVPWVWLFNVTDPKAIAEIGPAMTVFVFCVLVNLPFGLVQKIHNGYQEGYLNGIWRAGGSLLALISILIAIYLKADLPWLVLAMAGSPVILMIINMVVLVTIQRPWLALRLRLIERSAAAWVLKSGFLFFILQLASAVGFQSDNLVVARFLGAGQVPQYAIPMKLFMFIPMMINFVLAPLWPAYGEAIAKRDVGWVKRVFKKSIYFSFGFSLIPAFLFIAFGKWIIQLWAGPDIQPSFTLLLGLGLWVLLLSLGGPIAMLLNGLNIIGFQVVCAILMAVGNLSFSIFFVQRIGVSGPVYGSSISWLVFSLLPSIFYIPRLFASWKVIESLK